MFKYSIIVAMTTPCPSSVLTVCASMSWQRLRTTRLPSREITLRHPLHGKQLSTATHTLRLPSSLSCVNTPLDQSLTPTPAMDASLRNAKGLHDELGALQANLLRRFTNLVNLAEVSPFSSQPHLIFSLTLYGPGQTRHSRRFGSHAISNSSRDSSSGVQFSFFFSRSSFLKPIFALPVSFCGLTS